MNAVGYARVSTDGQATDGVSLDAQQARIRAWCEANSFVLIGFHVDAGLSGCRADNRPALQTALSEACRHKAAFIVYSLSRLARSTKDAIDISERLGRNSADLVSLSERIDTTTAAGKMVFRMLAVLAEFERDQVAERTKSALFHMRNEGKRISGRLPYGYNLALDGRNLLPNPQEQEGIQLILALKDAGLGMRRIAAALSLRSVPTKTGTAWSPQTIGAILKRERKTTPVNVQTIE